MGVGLAHAYWQDVEWLVKLANQRASASVRLYLGIAYCSAACSVVEC